MTIVEPVAMRRFLSTRCIVVGGASGIGAATVEQLREEGGQCLALDRSGGDQFVDLRDAEAIPGSIQAAAERLTGIDILIVTAGATRYADVDATSPAIWQELVETNLVGPGLVVGSALRWLRKSSAPSVVLVSSAAGLAPRSRFSGYGSTKAGLIHWVRCAAKELGQFGVRVNCVAPGPIDTPMLRGNSPPNEDAGAWPKKLGSATPLGRTGTPGEVSHAICFLASSEASYVTGAVLTVDGGSSL